MTLVAGSSGWSLMRVEAGWCGRGLVRLGGVWLMWEGSRCWMPQRKCVSSSVYLLSPNKERDEVLLFAAVDHSQLLLLC